MKENINIPKGVDTGVNLRLSKKGNTSIGGRPGDLMIKVEVKSHPYFKREGANIFTEKYITFTQAVLGANLPIKTLYGNKNIKISPGTPHDS